MKEMSFKSGVKGRGSDRWHFFHFFDVYNPCIRVHGNAKYNQITAMSESQRLQCNFLTCMYVIRGDKIRHDASV